MPRRSQASSARRSNSIAAYTPRFTCVQGVKSALVRQGEEDAHEVQARFLPSGFLWLIDLPAVLEIRALGISACQDAVAEQGARRVFVRLLELRRESRLRLLPRLFSLPRHCPNIFSTNQDRGDVRSIPFRRKSGTNGSGARLTSASVRAKEIGRAHV